MLIVFNTLYANLLLFCVYTIRLCPTTPSGPFWELFVLLTCTCCWIIAFVWVNKVFKVEQASTINVIIHHILSMKPACIFTSLVDFFGLGRAFLSITQWSLLLFLILIYTSCLFWTITMSPDWTHIEEGW